MPGAGGLKGGKHRPEDGDVEEEVADRAQKAPAGPANRVLGLANPLDQIADQAGPPGRAVLRDWRAGSAKTMIVAKAPTRTGTPLEGSPPAPPRAP